MLAFILQKKDQLKFMSRKLKKKKKLSYNPFKSSIKDHVLDIMNFYRLKWQPEIKKCRFHEKFKHKKKRIY